MLTTNPSDMYRGQLISNPNMMFFLERLDTPLVDLDVTAWLFLAQITGDLPLPEVAEMKEFNLNTFLDAMADPICGSPNCNWKPKKVRYMKVPKMSVE